MAEAQAIRQETLGCFVSQGTNCFVLFYDVVCGSQAWSKVEQLKTLLDSC